MLDSTSTPCELSILRGESLAVDADRWQRVRGIYEEALDAAVEEREALVERLCGGDGDLKAEIDRLLASAEGAAGFLEGSAFSALRIAVLPEGRPELAPGTMLSSRFEILRFLNRGGMGEVYEAWDSDLREVVALKTIRPEIAAEASAIDYFKKEVRQGRQISHPNICRIYDLFSHAEGGGERLWFLTMQFLEGRTLADRLREDGPVSCKEALGIAEQMVRGLAAAHDSGIVHRDFKSSNVMLVGGDGGTVRAVITDFGLSARISLAGNADATSRWEGTPAYAAPEQWRDGVVGYAADQYAFGVVLCEMVTGERPLFNPAGGALRLPASREIEARWASAIRRCMEHRPEDRFGCMTEILVALDPNRQRRALARVAGWVGLPVLTAAVLLVIVGANRPATLVGLRALTPPMSLSANPSLSRDGKTVAYMSDKAESGNPDIWVKHLPDGEPIRITTDPASDDEPSLSPDGRTVVFRSDRDHGGIYIADAAGGGERLLVAGGRKPQFSPDGRSIVYWTGDVSNIVASGRIYWMNLTGGLPIQLAANFADARKPVWSSDGRHVLFSGCSDRSGPMPACGEWWVTSIDGALPLSTGAMALLNEQQIKPMGEFGGWSGDTLLFTAEQNQELRLWELKLSTKDFRAKGPARQLTPGALHESAYSSSLADGNVIAFNQVSHGIHIWRIGQAFSGRRGLARKITQDAEVDVGPSVSHNGRWLIFARGLGKGRSILIRDDVSGKETPVDGLHADKFAPIIDDSGTILAYESWEKGVPSIFVVRRGKGEAKVCSSCRNPTSWFDGTKGVLYSNSSMSQIDFYDLDRQRTHMVLSKPGAFVSEASWSAENQFVLFTVATGNAVRQIFAARFARGTAVPESNWIAITDVSESGDKPRWSNDGKTIYYFSRRDNHLCLWSQRFDPARGRIIGNAASVAHYHNEAISPGAIYSHSSNLSTGGDSIYFNVEEVGGTIWTGKIDRGDHFLMGR